MKKLFLLSIGIFIAFLFSSAQRSDSAIEAGIKTDSTLRAKMEEERGKKEADSIKMEKLLARAQYPYLKGGKLSGVIPVKDADEIPDPNHDYKLLFEVVINNPDSLAKDINSGFDEVARILNLHFASGIPPKRIIPVIVVHGQALDAITNNKVYKKVHSIDNPNIRLIHDLGNVGAKFIACGQAMAYFELKKDDLLPGIKISLTAQTVLSNYESQGYVLYSIIPNR